MLIAADGRAAGLLSGGCLEADLMERARAVLDTGNPMLVEYDTRSSDDVLWGIGLGCEGAMTILLQRLDPAQRLSALSVRGSQPTPAHRRENSHSSVHPLTDRCAPRDCVLERRTAGARRRSAGIADRVSAPPRPSSTHGATSLDRATWSYRHACSCWVPDRMRCPWSRSPR